MKIPFIDKYEIKKLVYEGKLKEFVSRKPTTYSTATMENSVEIP